MRSNERKMPSKSQIQTYWYPHLVRIGKQNDEENWCKTCFACSANNYFLFEDTENSITLHRAHIFPKVLGGSDEVDNIHLLCQYCHLASEYLYGTDYWAWFMKRSLRHTLQIYASQVNLSIGF